MGPLIFVFVLSTVGFVMAEDSSYIVGRLLGPLKPSPASSGDNSDPTNPAGYPEFPGFRFVNSQSGKKINMRPDSRGYFSKSLEPGKWVFERLRKDRPGGEGPKVLEIMIFEVPAGSLVNLGTIIIVVDGEPTESIKVRGTSEQGTYVYTYHYERSDAAEDNNWPLDNLKRKDPKTLDSYQDNIVQVKDPVITEIDRSRVILRVP